MRILEVLVEQLRRAEFDGVLKVGLGGVEVVRVHDVVAQQQFDEEVSILVGYEYFVENYFAVDEVHAVQLVQGLEQLAGHDLDGVLRDCLLIFGLPVDEVLFA